MKATRLKMIPVTISHFFMEFFMKWVPRSFFVSSGLILASCQSSGGLDQIISQKYVHKYGFDVCKEEWDERSQDGQVVETLKSGIKIAKSYENGQLHGPTTYTFANSSVIEKQMVYDQGTLLKETVYDIAGIPISEELYEFDERKIVTLWNEQGVPLSIEEYESGILVDGRYFTAGHELEAKVENGYGHRIKRDRSGALLTRDKMENGQMTERTSFHPNGELNTISHYHEYQLHGPQYKFTPSGRPLLELSWNHGVLDGQKVIYRNGIRVAEIPFVNGEKHGVEYHYDDLGNLISETMWKNDTKHGCCKSYTEESVESEWFHNGMAVSAEKFILLENREQIIAEMSLDR